MKRAGAFPDSGRQSSTLRPQPHGRAAYRVLSCICARQSGLAGKLVRTVQSLDAAARIDKEIARWERLVGKMQAARLSPFSGNHVFRRPAASIEHPQNRGPRAWPNNIPVGTSGSCHRIVASKHRRCFRRVCGGIRDFISTKTGPHDYRRLSGLLRSHSGINGTRPNQHSCDPRHVLSK